jgi:hypothetical protein
MMFSTIDPSPGLRELVRDYLIAHFRFDPRSPVPQKCYAPKPEQGITFFVRGRPRIVHSDTEEVRVAPPVAIFGQQMKRCDVHLAPEFLMFRVHFQPGALFRLLRVPLGEFGDDYFDAASLPSAWEWVPNSTAAWFDSIGPGSSRWHIRRSAGQTSRSSSATRTISTWSGTAGSSPALRRTRGSRRIVDRPRTPADTPARSEFCPGPEREHERSTCRGPSGRPIFTTQPRQAPINMVLG